MSGTTTGLAQTAAILISLVELSAIAVADLGILATPMHRCHRVLSKVVSIEIRDSKGVQGAEVEVESDLSTGNNASR